MKINPLCLASEGVRKVIATLEAYRPDSVRLVGGCVRDAIMGRQVNDIDFATPVTPEVVMELFVKAGFHVEPTGIDHGTVTVIWDHEPFEITTLRRDVETDGRRAVVAFTEDWAEDAFRRDFTFNALYMGPDGTVYDYNDGIKDAKDRRIRFMGNAEDRVREDYLRILRMFRFQSVLCGHIDAEAEAAVTKLKDGINLLSGERLEKEILKMLGGDAYDVALTMMADTGVFEVVFGFTPDIKAINLRMRMLRSSAYMVGNVPPLAVVIGWQPEVAKRLLDRWKASNALRDHVVNLIVSGPFDMQKTRPQMVREAAYRSSSSRAACRVTLSWLCEYEVSTPSQVEYLRQAIRAKDLTFPVQGRDVLAMGVKPGKLVGDILRKVEDRWIAADFPDEAVVRDWLTEEVTKVAA